MHQFIGVMIRSSVFWLCNYNIYGISRFYFQNYLKTSLLRIFVRSTAPPRIVITLAILMPVVTAPHLRFVRQQPKPYLRSIGPELGTRVPYEARVLVHIPKNMRSCTVIVMQHFANRFPSHISVAPASSLSIIKTGLNREYASPQMVWSICGSRELEQHFTLKLQLPQKYHKLAL